MSSGDGGQAGQGRHKRHCSHKHRRQRDDRLREAARNRDHLCHSNLDQLELSRSHTKVCSKTLTMPPHPQKNLLLAPQLSLEDLCLTS